MVIRTKLSISFIMTTAVHGLGYYTNTSLVWDIFYSEGLIFIISDRFQNIAVILQTEIHMSLSTAKLVHQGNSINLELVMLLLKLVQNVIFPFICSLFVLCSFRLIRVVFYLQRPEQVHSR